jgi:excisionase family DNA binding protein
MAIRESYVRVKQAAEMLGVCPNTIRVWGMAGKIPEYRHPVNNYRLFKRSDLDRLLKKLDRSGATANKLSPRKPK